MTDYLPTVELNSDPETTAAVIWLHGLGANGHDFVPVVPELRLPAELKVRFVFPH
ncbi:MAG TPA: carboxylesterase, partial [Pseudomonadaceae bacterium]|nr:carboxylesterase [Pseudomonadaceae bacterium]